MGKSLFGEIWAGSLYLCEVSIIKNLPNYLDSLGGFLFLIRNFYLNPKFTPKVTVLNSARV